MGIERRASLMVLAIAFLSFGCPGPPNPDPDGGQDMAPDIPKEPFESELGIISLDTGDASDQVEMFTEEYGVTYTILHDPQMRGMDLYNVPGLPATFLIDREGILRWIRYGPILEGDADFLGVLEELLS